MVDCKIFGIGGGNCREWWVLVVIDWVRECFLYSICGIEWFVYFGIEYYLLVVDFGKSNCKGGIVGRVLVGKSYDLVFWYLVYVYGVKRNFFYGDWSEGICWDFCGFCFGEFKKMRLFWFVSGLEICMRFC